MKQKHHIFYLLPFFLLMGPWLLGQQSKAKPISKFNFEGDNNLWSHKNEEGKLNLVAYLKALEKVETKHKNYPLNLSIVIDRSGSMEGESLEKTKQAVEKLINRLTEADIVSIVTYESEVQVVVEAQRVTDKKSLIRKVKRIKTGGSTFLSGGMEKGYELVKKMKDKLDSELYVHRVILLSDGHANEGILDLQTLQRIASTQLQQNNISISTIGFGGGYNEELMTGIAKNGTGNYYFIANASEIDAVFNDELNGVQQLLAKKTKLTITFPENAVTLRQVHQYNYTMLGRNTIEIPLNDVFMRNEKSCLLEFNVKGDYHGEITFHATLNYLNALSNLTPIEEKRSFTFKEAPDPKDLEKSYREFGLLARSFTMSTEKYQMATTAAEAGRFKESKGLLESALQFIQEYNSKFKPHPFLESIHKELKDYKKELKEMQQKPKKNRKMSGRGKRYKMHKAQGCPSFI